MEATIMNRTYHRWIFLGLLTSGLGMVGCASLEDLHYQSVNRLRAKSAWGDMKACLPKGSTNKDYAHGFQEGYYSVASGGSHCPPVTPPPCYWAAKYQSTEGQSAVTQWYQGFQAGVVAADKDGRSIWTTVPTQDGPGVSGRVAESPEMTYSTDSISK